MVEHKHNLKYFSHTVRGNLCINVFKCECGYTEVEKIVSTMIEGIISEFELD